MSNATDGHEGRRKKMVERQIAARGVRDDRLLEAMGSVPREEFVAEDMVEFAYEDSALPIESEQTISQPYIVALMIEALDVKPEDRVLEVGAGSGYAAAVLGEMAAQVFAVERHRSLAEAARRTVRRLGYENVEILLGDGTLGWDAEAPFDAILVSAGGAEVPQALKDQLAPGGRMIMPVGGHGQVQELRLFEKDVSGALSERSLGAVRFVPLVASVAPDAEEDARGSVPSATLDVVRRHALPYESLEDIDYGGMADRAEGHTTVLMGEASHGTSEFYAARARLTRELIERGAISFVAVEADWPDASHLDRYVRGIDRSTGLTPFQRFPRWMWANEETLGFLRWLRAFNEDITDPDDRVGFFGLDLYSLHASIDAVLGYLEDVDPEAARLARDRFGCLTPFEKDPQTYGRLATTGRLEACEDEVLDMLSHLLDKRIEYERQHDDGLRYVNALENARLVANAERYYRAMYESPAASWNLRDQHMFDTLHSLLRHHGDGASAAVWAHNSHLGDASATEMGAAGKHNVGQLCRERFGVDSYALGMGTHAGTVMAAHDWGGAGEVMNVKPSLESSYERLSHDVEAPVFSLPLREAQDLRTALAGERLERAIGVIYRPATERMSHYFHATLPRQFDEWLFFDRSTALTPLEAATEETERDAMDTYPFAL
ncbi:MAG: protein-L-isoaspartate(D-aspartate) O-methyltransferase [Longimicrobiales bacterium]|nr:protein-L-isoaspartate(D-aspartate) O-methyltransferase [Longimicrobiales bacterium]